MSMLVSFYDKETCGAPPNARAFALVRMEPPFIGEMVTFGDSFQAFHGIVFRVTNRVWNVDAENQVCHVMLERVR